MDLDRHPQVLRPSVAAVDLVQAEPMAVTGEAIGDAQLDSRTRAFWDFCQKLPTHAGLPHSLSAGAEVLRPWLGNLMILDPVARSTDFRYRLYGSEIARSCGFDMTGRLVSAFSSKTGSFFLDSYRTCLRNRVPVLTKNVAEHASGMVYWERLLIPFHANNDSLQIVATNYPIRLSDRASATGI